jgi:hypothetical protein
VTKLAMPRKKLVTVEKVKRRLVGTHGPCPRDPTPDPEPPKPRSPAAGALPPESEAAMDEATVVYADALKRLADR